MHQSFVDISYGWEGAPFDHWWIILSALQVHLNVHVLVQGVYYSWPLIIINVQMQKKLPLASNQLTIEHGPLWMLVSFYFPCIDFYMKILIFMMVCIFCCILSSSQ